MELNGRFNFNEDGRLFGVGGGLELGDGELKFEDSSISALSAQFMLGAEENYFAGNTYRVDADAIGQSGE